MNWHPTDATDPFSHHARLVVGAASTLAVFLFETHGTQALAARKSK